MLHILFNSPFRVDIDTMLNMLMPNDNFIALQDGVYIALENNFFYNQIINKSKNLYVLQEDMVARGMIHNSCSKFKLINYANFVNLTEKNKKYINW
ncbi:sulfurtransferase complex subunit TusB [Buchnera aphidicola]|uniref:sulfurtransferase complex subunit TusB n=1 Tax=Buchnera aphidicola TaxID=9 RepID=UPI0031B88B98